MGSAFITPKEEKMRRFGLLGVSFVFAACSLWLTGGTAAAASAKYAAADNELTTCVLTSSGTITSQDSPGVSLAGLTGCTYNSISASSTASGATQDGPNWVVVSEVNIHTSSSQSLFVTPSLVTGLYTEVKNIGSGYTTKSTSTAQVLLRVVDVTGCSLNANTVCSSETQAEPVVDCANNVFGCASPDNSSAYGVNFDERVLGLSSNLSLAQFIDLAIATADGHSFGFGFDDMTSGTHTVAVEAAVDTDGTGNSISAAAFGLGFTTVESVQLTQGANDMDF